MVKGKKVPPRHKSGAGGVVKMQQPVVDTPLADRMVKADGIGMLALLKTLQQHFGAKLVYFQDDQGEVGKKPGWL